MQYQWNEKKIAKLSKLCQIFRYQNGYNQYELLQKIITNTYENQELLITDSISEINYNEARHYFTFGIEYIPEILYNAITDFFFWCEDVAVINEKIEFKEFNLSNDDIISITYDIIASMNNRTVLKIYNGLLKHHQDHIHIQDMGLNPHGATEYLGGITLLDPLSRKSYINIFRNHTIEDIEIFVHETFHYIYNYLLYYSYKRKDIRMLGELEGEFGSLYATRYLEQNGFAEEAHKLRKSHINSIITSSYLIMLNHILIATSNNNNFNLQAANEMLNERLETTNITITEDDLPQILSIQGFEKITNIISYLIVLELINNHSNPSDILNTIYSLKYNDATNILENLENHNITFYKDQYQDFIKEYSLTH